RLDPSLMQLDQPLGERQSDSEPAVGTLVRPVELCEWLEDVLQHFRRNAHAVVANAHDRLTIFRAQPDLDLSSRWRVFDRVVKDVRDDLSESDAISADVYGDVRRREGDLVSCRLRGLPMGIDDALQEFRELDRLRLQADTAARDARHVEKIVDEVGHVPRLALENGGRGPQLGCQRLRVPEQLRRRTDGSERVPELVS